MSRGTAGHGGAGRGGTGGQARHVKKITKRDISLQGRPDRQDLGRLGRSWGTLQDAAQQAGPAATASYTLVGGIVLLGGLGYGIDRWRGWAPWGLLVGLSVGVVVGFYQLIKATWRS